MSVCGQSSPFMFSACGILKPQEDPVLLSKGASHYLDIREVSCHYGEHMWGEFGKGFSGLASFDEQ